MNLNQITIPSINVKRSAEFYKNLGLQLIVESIPRYVRFLCPDGNSTFSVHSVDKKISTNGILIYFECAQLDRTVELLKDKGIEFTQDPKDQSWLWREARLSDPDGNQLCLFYAGENRINPPWRIKH